nr:hypothetical protein [Tanacetum cinerariifolium]
MGKNFPPKELSRRASFLLGGGTNPRTKLGHKKHSTSSKQPYVSSKEETKGGSSKALTSSKIGHSKKRKESSSAMDSNPSQTLVSILVDTRMHKKDQQATGGPTSLGVISEVRTNPQLGSVSTAEANPRKSNPSDFVPQQQDKTQSVSERLETILTQSKIGKRVSSIARQVKEDDTSRTIKLEDLAKLASSVQPSFKDLDSPEDDPIIVVVDSDEDEEAYEVHATTNVKTEDTSSQKHKLELEKNKDEAALFKAQPFFLNVGQLNELLAKLKTLDALPSLLNKDKNDLNQFAQAIVSKKTIDASVPLAGQVGTQPVEREKNTNQATISQLFQRKSAKNANMTK